MENTYVELIKKYNEYVEKLGSEQAIIPIGENTDKTKYFIEETNVLLNNFDALEKKMGKQLPESYVDYIRSVGLYGIWRAKHHEMHIYSYSGLLEFNSGVSSYEEMKDYLIFGDDQGSWSWFFDVKNKLGKGKEAVYIVDRAAPMFEEYFIYKGKDFLEVIENFANGNELEDEYTFKPAPPTTDEITEQEKHGQQKLKDIDERLKKNPEEAERVYADMEKIHNYIKSFTPRYYNKMPDESFAYIDEVEKGFKQELPLLYLVLIRELRGGTYKSENFRFFFLIDSDIALFNIGKQKRKYLKDYLLFAQTGIHNIFMDINNKQGKGVNAIYFLELTEKKVDNAQYLAKDLVDLYRIIAENEKPIYRTYK